MVWKWLNRLWGSKTDASARNVYGPTLGNSDLELNTGIAGDSPIRSPEHDVFGVDPFARAIARSIAAANAGDGLVYAINGAWGSGKSSVINLILYHLSEPVAAGRIATAVFNPWWFSGAEALTMSFFSELRNTVGKSLDDRAREAMASLGGRLSSAGPLLGGIASLLVTPAAGAAVVGGTTLMEKLTRLDSTVEKEHGKLADALAGQDKKFLIVLDDIDRLNTDDALQIFKLIKSVGRLPNVIYLLAFDRHLAEKMVAERFPSEGAGYLEKVIQGAFDLPAPDPDDLRSQLLTTIGDVMGAPPDDKMQRFWNIFYDIVAPLLNTPRDAVRLSNAIKVSWPAIKGDVDRADLLAIEALRVFRPTLHQAIRSHPEMLTGHQSERGYSRQELQREYDSVFLEGLPSRQRESAKLALRRLFPRLEAVWENTWYSDDQGWRRDRLICAPDHFATYFAFAVTKAGITAAESDSLVQNAGKPGFTAKALLQFLKMPRRRGGTRAALALQELTVRAGDIAEADIPQLLHDIFSIADDLNVSADQGRGFNNFGSNEMRIHWLINRLLLDRFELQARTKIIREAAPYASLEWLVSLSGRCMSIKEKSETTTDRVKHNFADDETVDWLFGLSRDRLRAAAADGTLAQKTDIEGLLYRWRDRATPDEVREWTDAQLDNDAFVLAMAAGVVREMWSHNPGGFGWLGDRVARKTEYTQLKDLDSLLDIARFKARVAALVALQDLDPSHQAILQRFLDTNDRGSD